MNTNKINKIQQNRNKSLFFNPFNHMLAPLCHGYPVFPKDTCKGEQETNDPWASEGASNNLYIIYLQDLRVFLKHKCKF